MSSFEDLSLAWEKRFNWNVSKLLQLRRGFPTYLEMYRQHWRQPSDAKLFCCIAWRVAFLASVFCSGELLLTCKSAKAFFQPHAVILVDRTLGFAIKFPLLGLIPQIQRQIHERILRSSHVLAFAACHRRGQLPVEGLVDYA